MDLFSPLRLGVHVATDAVKLATFVPRLLINQLTDDADQQRFRPAARPVRTPDDTEYGDGTPPPTPTLRRTRSGTAPGGTGRRAPSPRATPGRATTRDPSVERTVSPPEPTSAAGASGGIGGTAAAPGDAAAAGAPDPTAASSATRARRTVPQGERRTSDVRPPRTTRARKRTEPKRSEIDRRRAEQRETTESPETTLAETEGSATPAATLRVDEPWDGYGTMKAAAIVTRVRSSDDATKAVVRLYEQTHKKRKSILDATAA